MHYQSGWGWLATLLIWLFVLLVLFWIIFYTFRPGFVLNSAGEIDTGRLLLAAFVAAIIVVIIIWLIKLAVTRSY
jgi:hypothetical protein